MLHSTEPAEIDTARMLESLKTAGFRNPSSRIMREPTQRPHELRGKSPAQLASEAACARVIAERNSINFSKPSDTTEKTLPNGCIDISLEFESLCFGDFVADHTGGCVKAGHAWRAPRSGSTAPPRQEPVGYSLSRNGLWASINGSDAKPGLLQKCHSASVLHRPKSACSRRSNSGKTVGNRSSQSS